MSDQYSIRINAMQHDENDATWRVKFAVRAKFIGSQSFEISVDDRDPAPHGREIMRQLSDIAQRAERQLALALGVLSGIAESAVDEQFKNALTAEVRSSLQDELPDLLPGESAHDDDG